MIKNQNFEIIFGIEDPKLSKELWRNAKLSNYKIGGNFFCLYLVGAIMESIHPSQWYSIQKVVECGYKK